jgi:hypothetical protein
MMVWGMPQHVRAGKNTFFGKTATMLQGDNEIGHLQKILLKVGRWSQDGCMHAGLLVQMGWPRSNQCTVPTANRWKAW